MSVDKYDDNSVELPDAVDSETLPDNMRSVSSTAIFITMGLAVTLFVLIAFLLNSGKERIIASVPELEKAWVVSRVEGTDLASDEAKTVLDGRGVLLYLVAYGYDAVEEQSFYYMVSPDETPPRLQIEGREIPREKIKKFSFIETQSNVFWYKIELSNVYLTKRSFLPEKRVYWTISRKHNMGNKWWAIADVRSDIYNYHDDYVGTARYAARLFVFPEGDSETILARLDTANINHEDLGTIPPKSHRVTITGWFRSGLDAMYRAYFNLPAFQANFWTPDAMAATESFSGGNSRSILIGALRLMGLSIPADDRDFLNEIAEPLYRDVEIDQFLFFRPAGQPEGIIPWTGSGAVRPGDIIVRGDRYAVIVENSRGNDEPAVGALTGDDAILDSWNGVVRQTYANVFAEITGPITIWRLRGSDTARQAE